MSNLDRFQQLTLEVLKINMELSESITWLAAIHKEANAVNVEGKARWAAIAALAFKQDGDTAQRWVERLREMNSLFIRMFEILKEMAVLGLDTLSAEHLAKAQYAVQNAHDFSPAVPMVGMLGLSFMMIADSAKTADAIAAAIEPIAADAPTGEPTGNDPPPQMGGRFA